ncbi:MAG: 1-acyl-sn-glycerol-3-phosphate acyltransferase [Deltaproteobacteria bacterium]|nr:1-acyl-sn-glycerol-3-phosphate acyltransferase [Deltaproteobacteria bacterium]
MPRSRSKAALKRVLRFLSPVDGDEDRQRAWGQNVDDLDREALERAIARMDPLFCGSGPYPVEVAGMEHVPPSPVLLVSNHSGGLLIPDAWGLGWLWYQHMTVERPLHGLAHEMMFKVRGTGAPMARLGALRAGPVVALEALRDRRHDIAVMPGGDLDVYRPYRDRFRVDFGGRKGYAKLALRAGVPIVPVAHSGAHETLIVLARGRRIAQATGIRRAARAEIFPISLTVPWGLTVGPLPNLPVPARFRYRFGPPVQISSEPTAEPTHASVDELDRRVRGALQAQLDQLRVETPSIQERLRYGLRR